MRHGIGRELISVSLGGLIGTAKPHALSGLSTAQSMGLLVNSAFLRRLPFCHFEQSTHIAFVVQAQHDLIFIEEIS